MIRASDLRSGAGLGFDFRSDHLLVLSVLISPWFNSSAALVNSQLVCLSPVGIRNTCVYLYYVS